MRRHRAFSLLELIVAVLVMGIVAAAACFRYSTCLAEHRVDAAARAIADDLRAKGAGARARNSAVTVVFDVANNNYTVTGAPNPNHPSRPLTVNLSDDFGVAVVSSSFVAATPLVYNGFGYAQTSGSIKVSNGGALRTITVDNTSGMVTYQ